jgi:hypothetical protein
MKTRYAKPFESVQVKIPYETGMDPYSGLVDLFEAKGLLQKDGNRLKYTDVNDVEHKEYRKAWTGEKLDMVMRELEQKIAEKDAVEEISPAEEIEETETNE